MVSTTVGLVRKENIQTLVDKLTKEEAEVVEDLKRILPHVQSETIRKSLEGRLNKGEECLRALQEGFVPVDTGYFTRVDVKSKWSRHAVKETLASMPPEIQEIWDKAKEKGIFKSFSVTTTGGDPVLVGNTGGKHFFIAAWLCLRRGMPLLGIGVKL